MAKRWSKRTRSKWRCRADKAAAAAAAVGDDENAAEAAVAGQGPAGPAGPKPGDGPGHDHRMLLLFAEDEVPVRWAD